MSKRAAFSVVVNGEDITTVLTPVVMSIRVSDRTGTSSDTADIEISDIGGKIVLPPVGAAIRIALGFVEDGVGTVFEGTVDELQAEGSRSRGRTLSISAAGFDTSGKAKERKRRHWDDKTVEEILGDAGKAAGIDEVRVDPAFGKTKRAYERMDDESFVAFGERLARELGGTFKISGKRAVLAKRNGGVAPSGAALSVVTAAWGVNLHSYRIAPYLGRPRVKRSRARYYDEKAATWKEVLTETEIEGAETIGTARFTAATEQEAIDQTKSDAAESEREGGEGTIVIEGNTSAQPEGTCIVAGTRPGIDGTYRIDEVSHEYSRSGFTTTLSLRQPTGDAGKDSRSDKEDGKKKTTKKGGRGKASADPDDNFALPTDPELGSA